MTAPGLAQERTSLAWQRTALAILTGSMLLARLTFDVLGVPALVLMLAAAALAAKVLLESRGRQRSRHPESGRPHDGRRMLLLAGATALLAVTEVLALMLA